MAGLLLIFLHVGDHARNSEAETLQKPSLSEVTVGGVAGVALAWDVQQRTGPRVGLCFRPYDASHSGSMFSQLAGYSR